MQFTSFQDYLERLYETIKTLEGGKIADYIPELTRADPAWFGIAIVTVDGHVYQVGDTRQDFTIQSISKAFTYGIALEDKGVEHVMSKIDVEPSGEAFNSISLEPETGRPRNPMINAGAIVTTGLINEDQAGGRLARLLDIFSRYTGRELGIDEEVYKSERDTGHRNRAISHLLRNYEILEADPEPVLDTYFRQCSTLINCRDLAVMGAALANDGVNPITGIRALTSTHVPRVLSVMATCGMYDYTGNWIYRVGMPSKSGVGGGILAVLPGQFGLAVFSPKLDPKGNSVRGIAVCEAISRDFGLHMLRTTRITSSSIIRSQYDLSQVRSKLQRPLSQSRYLDKTGHNAGVFELTGELMFVSAEILCNEISNKGYRYAIVDLKRVNTIDTSANLLLVKLVDKMISIGKSVLMTGYKKLPGFERQFRLSLGDINDPTILAHEKLDQAIEWCEQALLKQQQHEISAVAKLSDNTLCANFKHEELSFLQSLLERKNYTAGETICAEGDPADLLYFLESGRVSTWVRIDGQNRHRLFAAGPGWSFGESSLFGNHKKRTAEVVADTDVTLLQLPPTELENNEDALAIPVRMKMLSNLSEINMERLKQANGEIRMLTG